MEQEEEQEQEEKEEQEKVNHHELSPLSVPPNCSRCPCCPRPLDILLLVLLVMTTSLYLGGIMAPQTGKCVCCGTRTRRKNA